MSLFLSGCDLLGGSKTGQTQQTTGTNNESSKGSQTQEAQGAATVTISDSGVSPASVTVKAGESITWVNDTERTVQIGSDDHPTHKINPEVTGGQFVIGLNPGESKTVSVGAKIGSWGWHDHTKPSVVGTVVVQ